MLRRALSLVTILFACGGAPGSTESGSSEQLRHGRELDDDHGQPDEREPGRGRRRVDFDLDDFGDDDLGTDDLEFDVVDDELGHDEGDVDR